MTTGKITKWNDSRGFGFIAPDDGGNDVFLHVSKVRSGAIIERGCSVTFDMGTNERNGRSEAQNVVVVAVRS